jgi:amidophosphoribosyltransferase
MPFVSHFLRLTTERSFIAADQDERKNQTRTKLKLIQSLAANNKDLPLILIDDSIVRGTVLRNLINDLKDAGFKEIHFRSMFWPVKNSCPWGGIDMRGPSNQLMHDMDPQEAAESLGLASLRFATMEDIAEAIRRVSGKKVNMCQMCGKTDDDT